MIELKGCVILGKKAPKEEINSTFDFGQINHISYAEAHLYNLLKLKDQSLDKGEFIIDGVKIYPEEDNGKSLFFLAVNSLISIGLCFVVEKDQKKEYVKKVQDELIKLREMPCTSDIEKNMKIAAIFDAISLFSPNYTLVDLNVEGNKNNPELMRQLEKFSENRIVIVLDEKPIEEISEPEEMEEKEILMVDLNIGEETSVRYTKEKVNSEKFIDYENKNDNFFKRMWNTVKKNAMVFLSFVIPSIGIIAFLLLTPLYAKTDNKVLMIPFIITIIICFVLYMLMTYKCTDFDKKSPTYKDEKIMFFTINAIVTLIAYGLGLGIYLLFKNFDNDLKVLKGNALGIVLSIIFYLILVTANLYLYPVVAKIKSLFKKKK